MLLAQGKEVALRRRATESGAAAGPSHAGRCGVRVEHGTFRCRRGYDLYTTTFTPPVRRSPCCLVFHHGLSDHSARHRQVLAYLCAEVGIPVYTYDAHGHGRSGPDTGYEARALVLKYEHLLDDLLDFTRQVVLVKEAAAGTGAGPAAAAVAAAAASVGDAGCGSGPASASASSTASAATSAPASKPRVFLLGYSMGGLVSSLAVAATTPPQDPHDPSQPGTSNLYAGLMLTSALTDALHSKRGPVVRAILRAYVWLLAWFVPEQPLFHRNALGEGIRDPAALAETAADPLWYRGKFKVGTIAALAAGCSRLQASTPLLTVPIFTQHATQDVACDLSTMQAHLARLSTKDLTFHVVEGGFHDLHHDPETPRLLPRMAEWLKARVEPY
ncbi:hypothetical protein HYH03_007618 [Edaphochlamys debaryana]|uniref:Serine aminopeptidase S33 domain-containing protein n=1 Tax=Edaphochlamys debaryana TaxID=47281 RepID=A0A836C098_9CHLO|nr:hypothetical protein HYH03_007618 [Edaphochlamys debaryana]|eukprot:KAG2494263.1 hypothetical protein HYH03_007618 [Edaphochlamys debaryana]